MCGIGIPGELVITGDSLARGYLNNEALTNEKFISLELDGIKQKAYKTGDYGFWAENGFLNILGRNDDQVKINGHRIELGEVGYHLKNFSDISEVALHKREDSDKEEYLVGYYTSGTDVDQSKLRTFLHDKLPGYMVPSFLIQIEKIPLNHNGKIDFNKLKEISLAGHVKNENSDIEKDDTQQKLELLWAEILPENTFSLNANFFEHGGSSLKATRLMNNVNQAFNVNISLKDIFLHPDFSEMSTFIDKSNKVIADEVPFVEDQEFYELSNAQYRIWLQHEAQILKYSFNVYGVFEIFGTIDIDRLNSALMALINGYDVLRTTFPQVNGKVMQRILPEINTFNVHHKKVEHIEIKDVLEENIKYIFDIENGPLYHIYLYEIDLEHSFLLLNFHHLVFDGWSTRIFLEKLVQLYLNIDDQIKFPKYQYKDFSAWHNNILGSVSGLEKDRTFWLSQYQELPPELKFNFEEPSTILTRSLEFVYDKKRTEEISNFCIDKNVSKLSFFMVVFSAIIRRLSGISDFVIGVPISGRMRREFEDQIGLFTNTLPLRIGLESDDTFLHRLKEIENHVLTALSHGNYPIDLLLEDINEQHNSAFTLFDVALIIDEVDGPQNSQITTDLKIEAYPDFVSLSKHAMELYVTMYHDQISINLVYQSELFDSDKIKSVEKSFTKIIESLCTGKDLSMYDNSLLDEENIVVTTSMFNMDLE